MTCRDDLQQRKSVTACSPVGTGPVYSETRRDETSLSDFGKEVNRSWNEKREVTGMSPQGETALEQSERKWYILYITGQGLNENISPI